MKPLTIELAKGTKRPLQSVGWKSPNGNDCRRHFFALDPNGRALVVTPKPAMPEFYVPKQGAKPVFNGEPFPEAVCVEISPCRLLAPPCYMSQAELDGVFPILHEFEPWQWVYWQTHGQFLILETTDDAPLQARLDRWLGAMRAAYEHEAAVWRDSMKRTTNAPLKDLGLDTEEKRANKLRELQAQLDMVESEVPIGGMPCKGRLKLTLNEVKLGHEGIRDDWMREDWAAKNGEDLSAMHRERRIFRRWLETHTGTRANVFDATTREQRQEIAPPNFGDGFESDPRFLEGCAQARYRARFANTANTVVYLADCELREELTAEEIDEVAQLIKIPMPPEPIPWHSEDFREIYLYDRVGRLKDTALPHNSLRALCLLLAGHVEKPMPFTEIEPKIGALASELDKTDMVKKPSNAGSHQIRDLVNRTANGKKLTRWGVLTVTGTRERFIKLAPPVVK